MTEARLIRGQFLTLREQDYIKAVARGRGKSALHHRAALVTQRLTPIIVAATFGMPAAIFTEAAISFAGVGIRPPQASWGQMVGIASQPGYHSDGSAHADVPGPRDRFDDARVHLPW